MLPLSLKRKYWKREIKSEKFSYFAHSLLNHIDTIEQLRRIRRFEHWISHVVSGRLRRGLLIDQHLPAPVVTWKVWQSRLLKTDLITGAAMWYLYLLSWVATLVQILFVTLAIGKCCKPNSSCAISSKFYLQLLFQRPAFTTWQNLWRSTLWRRRRSSGGRPRSPWSPTSASSSSKASRPPWSSAGFSHNC